MSEDKVAPFLRHRVNLQLPGSRPQNNIYGQNRQSRGPINIRRNRFRSSIYWINSQCFPDRPYDWIVESIIFCALFSYLLRQYTMFTTSFALPPPPLPSPPTSLPFPPPSPLLLLLLILLRLLLLLFLFPLTHSSFFFLFFLFFFSFYFFFFLPRLPFLF